MARTLIANGYVVSVDPSRNIFPNGFVAIDGFDIVAVGAAAQMPPRDGFEKVIDADGCIVLPGLINMHQHHWYTLFKGLADGYLLEDWVANFLLPLAKQLGPEAMRISSAVAAMEMLATGTTCSFNHSVTTTDAELLRTSIEPQCEIGIRQVYGKELRCKTPGNPNHPLTLDEALAAFEEEYRRWHGAHDGLSRFGMVIESNAHWVAAGMSTEELICRGYELAKKLGLRISTHIAGGTFSIERGFLKYLRETGRTDVRYLMQLGLLDRHWLLIHGIHNTELDLEQIAHVGANLVYTPTSEAIRGGGIAPAANAVRAGVNVALGTDGPMVDYSVDMVEQMKACMLMQHVRHLDPTRISAERALEMATINAAKALGLENEIGSLEAGKRADIAVFDLRKPYVGVLHRPLSSFICAGKGNDARAVIVNGEIAYQDGKFPRCSDRDWLFAEAERIGANLVEQAGLSHRFVPAWRS
ncbi:MAG TPA: amidohydrolase family protein [Xanthobacteraceae bacterium]|jgi:5-methylthioadenosine/S-adenosylhomocysteine deaminase|nr:amidohydrolase family protein [Xanthobacteraceae bacterium]